MSSLLSRFQRHNAKTQYGYGPANANPPDTRQAKHSSAHAAMIRPSIGRWLKDTWLDILTFFIMGAIGLGVYFARPAPTRSFPVFFENGELVYPEFAYPLRNEIVPIWAAALMASLIPIFIILVMQAKIKSFWDANNAILGLLYSLISAAVFQVFLKWLIGGLRPHFLTVCEPDILPNRRNIAGTGFQHGSGFTHMYFDQSICTGDQDEIDDSLESFPSGHSTAAFAGFIFLFLYLNGRLKLWANYHPAYWKLVVTYMPVLGATLIGGSLTIDEYHNWYDVVAGAFIGTMFALSSYRMVFASIWDFRFNHIPLRYQMPFTYGAAGSDIFRSSMFTRKAGWGDEEAGAWGGAPFDIASPLRASPARQNIAAAPGVHPVFTRKSRTTSRFEEGEGLISTHSTIGRKPIPYPKDTSVHPAERI